MVYVTKDKAEALTAEALFRVQAKKRAKQQDFDPSLGATWDQAQAALTGMQSDLAQYGTYVHGLSPARHHQLWINTFRDLFTGALPQGKNKVLLLAPPNRSQVHLD